MSAPETGSPETDVDPITTGDKSLDRKDSDSVSISYTDGVSLDWKLGSGWSLLGIAQYQPPEGATNRPRAPLAFSDSDSRASAFVSLRNAQNDGLWALRSLSLTVLPHTLHAGESAKTYTAAVGNVAVRWPAESSGMHALIGGSLGYAPDVPESAHVALYAAHLVNHLYKSRQAGSHLSDHFRSSLRLACCDAPKLSPSPPRVSPL